MRRGKRRGGGWMHYGGRSMGEEIRMSAYVCSGLWPRGPGIRAGDSRMNKKPHLQNLQACTLHAPPATTTEEGRETLLRPPQCIYGSLSICFFLCITFLTSFLSL